MAAGEPFLICSQMHGKVLELKEGKCVPSTEIVLWSQRVPPTSYQHWRLSSSHNGWSHIVSAVNEDMVIDVQGAGGAGSKLISYPKKDPPASNQLFKIRHGGVIVCALDNMCLDIKSGSYDDGANAIVWVFKPLECYINQRFDFVPINSPPRICSLMQTIPGSTVPVYIQSLMNGMVVDLRGSSCKSGSEIIMSPRLSPSVSSQLWYLQPVSGAWFVIASTLDSQMVLDVRKAGGSGSQVIIYRKKSPSANNQMFSFRRDGVILSALGAFCLDIRGRDDRSGASVIIWNVKQPGENINQTFDILAHNR